MCLLQHQGCTDSGTGATDLTVNPRGWRITRGRLVVMLLSEISPFRTAFVGPESSVFAPSQVKGAHGRNRLASAAGRDIAPWRRNPRFSRRDQRDFDAQRHAVHTMY